MRPWQWEGTRVLQDAKPRKDTALPEESGMLIYDTRSIQDHASQKDFSRPARAGCRVSRKIVTILGRVVQHRGDDILKCSSGVGFAGGSARYRAMEPTSLQSAEAGQSRVVGSHTDTEQTFDGPRFESERPQSTFLSLAITKGRDQFCTYCSAPWKYTA